MKGFIACILAALFVQVVVCEIDPEEIKAVVAAAAKAVKDNEVAINHVRTHMISVQGKILTLRANVDLEVLNGDKNVGKVLVNLGEEIVAAIAVAGKLTLECHKLQKHEVEALTKDSLADLNECRANTLPETDGFNTELSDIRSELFILELGNGKTIADCLDTLYNDIDELKKCLSENTEQTKVKVAADDDEVAALEKKVDSSGVIGESQSCAAAAVEKSDNGADKVLADFQACLDK